MGTLGEHVNSLIGATGKRRAIVVSLTEIGKNRIEGQIGTGPEIRIMQFLDENGPSTFAEIARGVGYPDVEKVRAICVDLKQKQCIMRSN